MIRRTLVALAALTTMSALSGCVAMIDPDSVAVATPWALGGIMSFAPEPASEPRAEAVDAQVARLLDRQQSGPSEQVVAAR